MLSNMKSPALYVQAAFRAQNPCLFSRDGKYQRKENAYAFHSIGMFANRVRGIRERPVFRHHVWRW